jgi:hypothetical protein
MHYVAEINRNMIANEFDDIDIFDLLLSYGGDVNFQTRLVNMILEFSRLFDKYNFEEPRNSNSLLC